MAKSLLAHLYSRIKGSQEDVATYSLQYLLTESYSLNVAFNNYIAEKTGCYIDESVHYVCQVTGKSDKKERPDMVGVDKFGNEKVICEMKFYAGLTQNQPLAYLDRLKQVQGDCLMFVCPKARITSLWGKLNEICSERNIEEISECCIKVDDMCMGIMTWTEIINYLKQVASVSAPELMADISQLEGYCEQLDEEAFIPFSGEELTAENAIRAERFYAVIDETMNLLMADKQLKTSTNKLKATAYRKGYTRSLYVDDMTISLNYDRDLWKSTSSVETPFWVAIRNAEWVQTDDIVHKLSALPDMYREDKLWGMIFVALEPLQNATLNEICEDFKGKIIKLLNDCKVGK